LDNHFVLVVVFVKERAMVSIDSLNLNKPHPYLKVVSQLYELERNYLLAWYSRSYSAEWAFYQHESELQGQLMFCQLIVF
jgi:hypothetical protein